MDGIDLKITRIRSRVRQVEVAREMCISQSRLSHIELEERITPNMQQRYMDALEKAKASK